MKFCALIGHYEDKRKQLHNVNDSNGYSVQVITCTNYKNKKLLSEVYLY